MQQPKKYLRYFFLAAFVVFVFQNPASAAEFVNKAADLVSEGAASISTFANALDME